jgi:hypothetical protein
MGKSLPSLDILDILSIVFLREVLAGRKKLVKRSVVPAIDVPFYPEVSTALAHQSSFRAAQRQGRARAGK